MRYKVTYRVPHRRRREGRTDYQLRLRLLKSGKPRLVIRRSNNNTICQIVSFKTTGDATLTTADSKELKKLGWSVHCGNIPAAYLTGLLCGSRAKQKGIPECVLDLGLHTSTKGSTLYAALKGSLDAGLKVSHSPDILPGPERVSGKHIADLAVLLKKEPEKYSKIFSAYLKLKVEPEKLPALFEQVKTKVLGAKPEAKPEKPEAKKEAKPEAPPKPKGKPEKKRSKRPEKPI